MTTQGCAPGKFFRCVPIGTRRIPCTVTGRRALCLSPSADSAAAPPLAWTPSRLARVSRAPRPGPDALSLTELLAAMRQGESVWVRDVRRVYDDAANYNLLLCSSFLLVCGD